MPAEQSSMPVLTRPDAVTFLIRSSKLPLRRARCHLVGLRGPQQGTISALTTAGHLACGEPKPAHLQQRTHLGTSIMTHLVGWAARLGGGGRGMWTGREILDRFTGGLSYCAIRRTQPLQTASEH